MRYWWVNEGPTFVNGGIEEQICYKQPLQSKHVVMVVAAKDILDNLRDSAHELHMFRFAKDPIRIEKAIEKLLMIESEIVLGMELK